MWKAPREWTGRRPLEGVRAPEEEVSAKAPGHSLRTQLLLAGTRPPPTALAPCTWRPLTAAG